MDETTLRQLIAEGAKGSIGDGSSGREADGRLSGLVTLLNAAAAAEEPGPAHEPAAPAAEDAAFAAFLAARSEAARAGATADGATNPSPSGSPEPSGSSGASGPGRWRRLGRRGRTTVLGIAAVGLIGGGAAVATGSGPFAFHAEGRSGGPQPDRAVATAVPSPGRPSPDGTAPSAAPSPADGSAEGTPGAGPLPEETAPGPAASGAEARSVALCRALNERPASARSEALGTSRFGPLVDAAGSRGAVEAYCATLLAGSPGSPAPSDPGGPSTGPETGPPTDRPTGRPEDPGAGKPGSATGGREAPSGRAAPAGR